MNFKIFLYQKYFKKWFKDKLISILIYNDPNI